MDQQVGSVEMFKDWQYRLLSGQWLVPAIVVACVLGAAVAAYR